MKLTTNILTIIFCLIALLVHAQEKKLIGDWKLTSTKYKDTVIQIDEKECSYWINFNKDHTMEFGYCANERVLSGKWSYDKRNKTIDIIYDIAIENVNIWEIEKITRKRMVIKEAFGKNIFTKTK